MNKLDRPSWTPLDLIDQLEKALDLHAFPVNWPLGNGVEFKGVYDRLKKAVYLYELVPGGAYKAPVSVRDLTDPLVKGMLLEQTYNEVVEELEMLDIAHGGVAPDAVVEGETTPVLFA